MILFNYLCGKKIKDGFLIVISCAISYVGISIVTLVIETWLHQQIGTLALSAITAVFLLVLSIIAACIHSASWFSNLMTQLFNATPNQSIWRDVLDFEHGSNLKVYLKGKDYYLIGHLQYLEENGEDSWLSVNAFEEYYLKDNSEKNIRYRDNEKVFAVFRLKDVDYIEVFN